MTKNTLLVDKEKLQKQVDELLTNQVIDERMYRVLSYRFGLNNEQMHSERSTGHLFGIQRNSIRYWEMKIAETMGVDKIILTEILSL